MTKIQIENMKNSKVPTLVMLSYSIYPKSQLLKQKVLNNLLILAVLGKAYLSTNIRIRLWS